MPNTYVALRTETLATATNTVTFSLSGISGYTDLVLQYSPLASSNTTTHSLRLNGDSASNYSQTGLRGDGSSATSFRSSNQTSLTMYPQDYDNTTIPSVITVNLQNYNNATTFKTILWRAGMSAGGQGVSAVVGLWRKTPEAITSITLTSTNNFAVGSTFNLYGIANADQGAAKATGGIITEDSTYWYHTFGASGVFTPKQSLTCDYLVLAGGGGGGYEPSAGNQPGGGGAGGMRSTVTGTGGSGSLESPINVIVQNYAITVGAGGSRGASGITATSGSDSIFSIITSTGGGRGVSVNAAGNDWNAAATGGSGGGGGGGVLPGGAASPSGQGFAGGTTATVAGYYGSGGGGAAAAGQSNTGTQTNTAGGAGRASAISGSLVTYAKGGNGAQAGGTSGMNNTGDGGNAGGTTTGGNGGSGIVIIRYAK